jgi:nitrogen PTS system EIIA component
MTIKDFLSASHVVMDMRASDKSTLLRDLATRAATELNVSPDLLANEITKRDELGSTGIGGGVAIPHARLRQVKKPFGMLARLKNPVGFDAIDGQPVDLVFLLVLPAASQLDQLNALAAVARRLREREVLQKLRSATTTSDFYRTIVE